jgi:hypothetical protein
VVLLAGVGWRAALINYRRERMKTAIYIEDGTVQLVITPESEFEKNALSTFREKPLEAKLFAGSFYDCRGGWVRQKAYYGNEWRQDGVDDQSLILRMAPAETDR